jgi:hypothetical protein
MCCVRISPRVVAVAAATATTRGCVVISKFLMRNLLFLCGKYILRSPQYMSPPYNNNPSFAAKERQHNVVSLMLDFMYLEG